MELDLQSLFGLLCTAVLIGNCPPPPAFGVLYEGAIGQPRYRRHLFVSPWIQTKIAQQSMSLAVLPGDFEQQTQPWPQSLRPRDPAPSEHSPRIHLSKGHHAIPFLTSLL
jgi:hypothetical protein